MADVKITFGADTSGLKSGADQAEATLGGFASRAVAKGVAVGNLIFQVAKDSLAAIGGFVKDSINEAAGAERSLTQLRVALKNVGASYKELETPINRVVDGLARTTKFSDDDLRDAFTNLVRITGSVKGSMDSLSVVTDLAAARNLDLSSASDIVGKALAGNTTTLGKLFPELKGSTNAVAALGEKLRGTAEEDAKTFGGRLDEVFDQLGEVKEALGGVVQGSTGFNSILEAGANILAGLAGWIGRNAENLRQFFAAAADVGGAVLDVGKAVLGTLTPALSAVGGSGGILARMVGLLGEVSAGVRGFAGAALISFGHIEKAAGGFVERVGKVLKFFGIDVAESYGATLRATGESAISQGSALLEKAKAQHEQSLTAIRTGRLKAQATVEKDEESHQARVAKVVKKGTDTILVDHLDMEIARQKASRETNELFANTAELLQKQNLDAHAESWKKIELNVKRVKGDLADLLPPADALKKSIDENNKALKVNADKAKQVKQEFKDTVDEAVQIGRGLLDAAQAAGVMDREMASVLNSALSIGESLASLSVEFSAGGLVGVIGGIANVISTIGGSNAKLNAALDANRAALDRLSREVGNFNLGATGKTFAATEKAVAKAQEVYNSLPSTISSGQRGQAARNVFRRELIKQGVSVKDAEALLEELGFGGALEGDAAFGKSLGQLSQGLKDTEFGQFGQDFESQFRATTEGFGIHGTDKAGQLKELSELASRFSPALKEALASGDAKSALAGLFDQLKTGDVDAAAFGDLNANQFLDLLKSLLGLLDGGVTADKPTIDLPPNVPRTPIPPLDPELIGGLTGGFTPGDVGLGSLLGADSLLSGLGRLRGDFLNHAIIAPPLGGKLKPGLEGGTFNQHIAQQVSGDMVIQFSITPRDNTDPEEIAEVVAQKLGDRYTLQRQALGLG